MYNEGVALYNQKWYAIKRHQPTNNILSIYIYIEGVALYNQQWHAIKLHQPTNNIFNIYVLRVCGII